MIWTHRASSVKWLILVYGDAWKPILERHNAFQWDVDAWRSTWRSVWSPLYCHKSIYYRPQRSCGQGYVFTRVCDSVHRGSLRAGRTPRQGELLPGPGRPPPRARQTIPPTRQTIPPRGIRLQNTVYERPVGILLECILVLL